MSNNEMNSNVMVNLPIWVKAAVVLGFPSLISLILLAALLGLIQSPMTTMLTLLERQTFLLAKLDMSDQEQRRVLVAAIEYQNMLSRTICRSIVPSHNQYQCEPRWKGFEEK